VGGILPAGNMIATTLSVVIPLPTNIYVVDIARKKKDYIATALQSEQNFSGTQIGSLRRT
jgi:hypothetical protein